MSASRLIVTHIASGDLWAGAEVQLHDLIVALRRGSEARPTAVLFNEGVLAERLREMSVQMVVLDEQRMSLARQVWAVVSFLKDCGSHIAHTHRYKEHLIGGMAAALRGIPSIRTVHSAPSQPKSASDRILQMVDKSILSRTQKRAVCVSGDLAPRVRRQLPKFDIEVIENGIDVARIRQCARIVRPRPSDSSPLMVLWAGRLERIKRPDLVVTIAREVELRMPGRFRFTLCGEGSLAANVDAEITKCGMSHVVQRTGFETNLPARLAQADVLLMTSDHEGLPMVLLEAMALETPVIAPRVGGIANVLSEGRFGSLVDTQDPKAYANALLQVHANRRAAQARSREALAHVSTHYSCERMASEYANTYKSVLAY